MGDNKLTLSSNIKLYNLIVKLSLVSIFPQSQVTVTSHSQNEYAKGTSLKGNSLYYGYIKGRTNIDAISHDQTVVDVITKSGDNVEIKMLNRIGLFAYFPLYAVQASILVNFMAEHIYVAVKENRTLNSIVVLDWTYSIGNNNKLNGILFQGSGVQLNAFVNHRISYEGCLLLNILTNIAPLLSSEAIP